MMADDWGPDLQNLFDDAKTELDAEAFTTGVVTQTRTRKNRAIAGLSVVALMLVVSAWLFTQPVIGFVQLTSQFLTITLVDLGEGWLAWMFAPVNNIASLLVIGAKVIRMSWKKMTRAF